MKIILYTNYELRIVVVCNMYLVYIIMCCANVNIFLIYHITQQCTFLQDPYLLVQLFIIFKEGVVQYFANFRLLVHIMGLSKR